MPRIDWLLSFPDPLNSRKNLVKFADPLHAPAKSECKHADKRQPFTDSGWLVDLPDLLSADERDELARLQKTYADAERENLKYEPGKAHAYLDSIRARLDDPSIPTDDHAAALASIASGRVGFRELRKSTARQMSRASVAALPLAVSVLRRSIPVIEKQAALIDDDFRTHWQRCCGRDGCGMLSPLADGLRRLRQDVAERLEEYQRILQQQIDFEQRGTAEPYQHIQPRTMFRGILKWMPTSEGGSV